MLHNRQAPGRDFHKHFSLAPARSDTNPPSNPQSAPAPTPLQDRAQARNATSRAPHLSLISLAPPAPPRLRSPTSVPLPTLSPPSLPSLHFHQGPTRATPKGARGAQAGVAVGNKGTPSSQPQRHLPPTPPALHSPMYCRTAGRQNSCLFPERCHVLAGYVDQKTVMPDDTKETAVW